MIVRWLVVLAVVALSIVAGTSIADQRRTAREIRNLRDSIYVARIAADSCQNALAYAEMTFRRYGTVVDSLRAEVRAFEALDERGVPAAQYDRYLDTFDRYNDSVGAWEDRAAALKEDETACRAVIDRHNTLADSLRERIEADASER